MFYKEVDKQNRTQMIEFLSKHYRYYTMNTWNRSTSYANNVKLQNLDIPVEYQDMAYNLISSEIVHDDYSNHVRDLMSNFLHDTGYAMGFNGRSSGYLVIYDTKIDPETLQYSVMPGRGIDEDKDYEDWSMSELKERVTLVQKFDKTCDEIREHLLYVLSHFELKPSTILVPKTVLTLSPIDQKK